jgi:hypothetical protein
MGKFLVFVNQGPFPASQKKRLLCYVFLTASAGEDGCPDGMSKTIEIKTAQVANTCVLFGNMVSFQRKNSLLLMLDIGIEEKKARNEKLRIEFNLTVLSEQNCCGSGFWK